MVVAAQHSEFCTSKHKLLSHLGGKGAYVWHWGGHTHCKISPYGNQFAFLHLLAVG